ncbi:MAG: helix-turn-helix transcriptional regulator [Bacteroidaceae bacterium]|nr:helix-turn-helix transcriptional regulator [Bacteroidaceae bacterium]
MRIEKGLSQNQLSFLVFGRHYNCLVSNWERGMFCPSAFALKSLSEAFGCSIDALFKEVQDADA